MARTTTNNNTTSTQTMGEQLATYLSLKAKETEIKEQLKNLEASIQAAMGDQQQISYNGFVAKIEHGSQRRFDTTKFKADHSEIYESYRKVVETKSFKVYVEG